MIGERTLAYRRRLLRGIQGATGKGLRDVNLYVVRDPTAFTMLENEMYRVAADAYKDPATVPLGTLRAVSETRGGHTHTRFYGRPSSWMSQFAPPGRAIRRINEVRSDGESRVLYRR